MTPEELRTRPAGALSPVNVELSIAAINALPHLMEGIAKLRTALRMAVDVLELVSHDDPAGITVDISIAVGRKALEETATL